MERERLTYVFFTFPRPEGCKNIYDYVRKLKRILWLNTRETDRFQKKTKYNN
jgi:hypothetical protein